ncbi:hypothetical protein [Devosia chinhatensis]|nr:hypothetical protein [Devosia chinhatensis]
MTLAEITELLSGIGKRRPELMHSIDSRLSVEVIIEEAGKLPVVQ